MGRATYRKSWFESKVGSEKERISNKDILRVIAEDYGVKESIVKDISCGRTYSSVKVQGF